MPDLTDDQRQQIDSLIFAGQKIQAIKALREATGCGLADAKEVVEAREAQLMRESPDKFAPRRKGCAAMLMFPLVFGAALLLFLL